VEGYGGLQANQVTAWAAHFGACRTASPGLSDVNDASTFGGGSISRPDDVEERLA
jgi:hypothetical protein